VGVGCGKYIKIGRKIGQKGGPKKCFRGRQVGAFSVFWQGDTGIPFIFWRFLAFFRFFCRFRGWCNITAGPGYFTASPNLYPVLPPLPVVLPVFVAPIVQWPTNTFSIVLQDKELFISLLPIDA